MGNIFVFCTAQKMKFSIMDFFSKCNQIRPFTEEILNGKLHFLFSAANTCQFLMGTGRCCLWPKFESVYFGYFRFWQSTYNIILYILLGIGTTELPTGPGLKFPRLWLGTKRPFSALQKSEKLLRYSMTSRKRWTPVLRRVL